MTKHTAESISTPTTRSLTAAHGPSFLEKDLHFHANGVICHFTSHLNLIPKEDNLEDSLT